MTSALKRFRFSLRKLNHPISKEALVLEVGSGDSPCPRSDVLFDITLENSQRVGGRTVHDRPLVLGSADKLPFADKVFDYVLAYHVLEHMEHPDQFLNEIQRVGRAGYIETPSLWAERVLPLSMHKLEVGVEEGQGHPRLLIHKKRAQDTDPLLSSQFRSVIEKRQGLDGLDPAAWVTRYWWKDKIDYRIVNPEEPASWQPPREVVKATDENPRSLLRRVGSRVLNQLYPRKKFDLLNLLRCTACKLPLKNSGEALYCDACGKTYPVQDGIPRLF